MPALVLIGYWMLFTGITFVALQYLKRKLVCDVCVLSCWQQGVGSGLGQNRAFSTCFLQLLPARRLVVCCI